jgi:hypothetical protein
VTVAAFRTARGRGRDVGLRLEDRRGARRAMIAADVEEAEELLQPLGLRRHFFRSRRKLLGRGRVALRDLIDLREAEDLPMRGQYALAIVGMNRALQSASVFALRISASL